MTVMSVIYKPEPEALSGAGNSPTRRGCQQTRQRALPGRKCLALLTVVGVAVIDGVRDAATHRGMIEYERAHMDRQSQPRQFGADGASKIMRRHGRQLQLDNEPRHGACDGFR